MTMTTREIRESIVRGMEFLDREVGAFWRREIDCADLDLESGYSCILGQLELRGLLGNGSARELEHWMSPYARACARLGLDNEQEVDLGFTTDMAASCSFEQLTDDWKFALGCDRDN